MLEGGRLPSASLPPLRVAITVSLSRSHEFVILEKIIKSEKHPYE
jgi:hypothetical protein